MLIICGKATYLMPVKSIADNIQGGCMFSGPRALVCILLDFWLKCLQLKYSRSRAAWRKNNRKASRDCTYFQTRCTECFLVLAGLPNGVSVTTSIAECCF